MVDKDNVSGRDKQPQPIDNKGVEDSRGSDSSEDSGNRSDKSGNLKVGKVPEASIESMSGVKQEGKFLLEFKPAKKNRCFQYQVHEEDI